MFKSCGMYASEAARPEPIQHMYPALISVAHATASRLGRASHPQAIVSLLFSFMVIWDLPNLARGMQALKTSRLSFAYKTISPEVWPENSLADDGHCPPILPNIARRRTKACDCCGFTLPHAPHAAQ